MNAKKRLRLSGRGWTRFAFSYVLGSRCFRTGAWHPDPRFTQARIAEFWVGPFATAEEAFFYDL